MSGAWEVKAASRVLCAILHVDQTTIAWSFGLRNLQIPGHVVGLAGMPFDMARNSACNHCLSGPYEWLFFLDSDVIPPNDAVYRLMRHRLPIVSGIYCRRSPPAGVPVMIRGGQWVTEYPPNSIIDVDVVGAGCLLIHRSVLENLPPADEKRGKRWFDWRVDMRGIGVYPEAECMSEDFVFCLHARKHGYKINVDTSIMCRHVGLAQSTYANFSPCEAVAQT